MFHAYVINESCHFLINIEVAMWHIALIKSQLWALSYFKALGGSNHSKMNLPINLVYINQINVMKLKENQIDQ
jgi:hypothetical protein